MRRYTTAKTLALFLGVLSVAARSLPERQSEIDVHSPADVSDPKQRLEELGLVKVSEGVLDGNIQTDTYSVSNNTTFPKRDPLSRSCDVTCEWRDGARPDPGDCEYEASSIANMMGEFTILPEVPVVFTNLTCTIGLAIPSGSFDYNYLFLGAKAASLTNECIVTHAYNYGRCTFNHLGINDPPYIVIGNRDVTL